MHKLLRKCPAGPTVTSECKGSFDCVSVRFVDGNFAQDDMGLMNA
jgi:hypothetical protein